MVQRITFLEVQELLASDQSVVYLDVRSIPEFEAGHVPRSFNIPLLHMGPAGMQPNPRFGEDVAHALSRDTKVVVGCRSGGRSARAASMLEQLGYKYVYDYVGGWGGGHGDPGWVASGGQATTGPEPGRNYEDVKK